MADERLLRMVDVREITGLSRACPTKPSASALVDAGLLIGLEVCRQLAAGGVNVILTARDAIAGSKAAAKLVKKGLPVTLQPLDVADPASIPAFADHIRGRSIVIDILVNNAGVSLKGFNTNAVRKTKAVNFFGAMHLTDTLMPSMTPDVRIVMVSSGLGKLSCLSPDRQET